ncbi:MAG: GNAT family N-acetyltransferase [Chloroflexi bacterium]|nr:GNAT family N-acetyltransferase [Chloroflexota bacterium]MCL5275738.1 GNAT family N-acetyltransferase [Chloroflexota bacterium]
MQVFPLTEDRWDDLEMLFGEHGAYSGCWCMYWRLPRRDFAARQGEGNKQELHAMVASGRVPGLLGYIDGIPAAWCSLGPRSEFVALQNSRNLKPVDDQDVWSIVCFFVARPYRRQGVMRELLTSALGYAREHDARIVEGYPLDMDAARYKGTRLSGSSGYMGVASTFRDVGFVEVKRATSQLYMRYSF